MIWPSPALGLSSRCSDTFIFFLSLELPKDKIFNLKVKVLVSLTGKTVKLELQFRNWHEETQG